MASTEIVINPDKFQTFFTEIETRKTLLTTISDLHKALIANFNSLSQTLTLKTQTLYSQIEFFNSHSKKSLESLENRQNVIPEQESSAVARIEERKAAAFFDIECNGNCEDKELGEILRVYFWRMEASGLISFMLVKRKESVALMEEIALAVDEAVDAMSFVLDAVEEFVGMKIEGKVGMADRRWASSLLIQVALPLHGLEEGVLVARSLKDRAVKVLEKWKSVWWGRGWRSRSGGSEYVLQVMIRFGLKEMMGEEVLRKLILEFAGRRNIAKLAVALGFAGG